MAQVQRMIRMTVAHYKRADVSEEDFHRFVVNDHAIPAARLHAKNGAKGFGVFFTPSSFHNLTADLNNLILETNPQRDPWRIRPYDAQVEFLFPDMETFLKAFGDPEFQKLAADEAAYVEAKDAEVSIGWLETYVADGNVVGVVDGAKSSYLSFAEASVAPSLPK